MATINWNNGQLINMQVGDTATCNGNLNAGQLYGLFFYNSAQNDTDTTVTITGNNGLPPVKVLVPGTTGNQGLAGICFVSGDDTTTIAASILQPQPGASLQAFICSVKMPTNTDGISNQQLPTDGQLHPFNKFTRYYAVLASHWYSAMIQSTINAFISVQFNENTATVFCVNAPQNFSFNEIVSYYGTSAKALVTLSPTTKQSISWYVSGTGVQTVWINSDSVQNSESASISVQSMQALFA